MCTRYPYNFNKFWLCQFGKDTYILCLTNYNKQKCFEHNNYYSYLSETNAFKRQTDDDKFEHIQAVFGAFCLKKSGVVYKLYLLDSIIKKILWEKIICDKHLFQTKN